MFRTVPILVFILLAFTRPVLAQNNPAYTINDVKVDIVAETSVIARNQAFSAAQAQGFKMLATRFLTPDELATFTPPDAVTIAGMVSDFEITSEQMSKRRYLGTYLFRFKAGPVNRYFGHGPVENFTVATERENKLLVLPYFSQKNGKSFDNTLWDVKKNPWLETWQKQVGQGLLIIPTGDMSDTMDVRDPSPENLSQSSLKRIRARYDARDVAIVNAVFDPAAANILTIKLFRTDAGRVELTQTIPIAKGNAKKLGELLASALPQIKTILENNWKGDANYGSAPDDTLTAKVQSTTPAGNAYTPQAGQIKVTARFSNINEWLNIRRSLNDIAPLKSLLITSLATNQAIMEFTYSDWMALTSSLSSRGISLNPTGPSEYLLIKSSPTGYVR